MEQNSTVLDKGFYRPADLAQVLGCSVRTVTRMVQAGELPAMTRFSARWVGWRAAVLQAKLAGIRGASGCRR